MIAGRQSRGLENKPMMVVLSATCFMTVGSVLVGRRVGDETVIDEELHFDPLRRLCFVYYPSGNSLAIGPVQYPAQISIGSREIEAYGDRRHQERFGHRF